LKFINLYFEWDEFKQNSSTETHHHHHRGGFIKFQLFAFNREMNQTKVKVWIQLQLRFTTHVFLSLARAQIARHDFSHLTIVLVVGNFSSVSINNNNKKKVGKLNENKYTYGKKKTKQ
jgi:hypothetical protein